MTKTKDYRLDGDDTVRAEAVRSMADPDRKVNRGWHKLRAEGKSAHEWAREHGFSPQLVYAVLRGERKCFRGKSHQVAIELGLKQDPHSE